MHKFASAAIGLAVLLYCEQCLPRQHRSPQRRADRDTTATRVLEIDRIRSHNLHAEARLHLQLLQYMLNMGEPRSNLRAAPATADFQEPVQASLSLAHNFIAQGNTTAALQVRCQNVISSFVLGQKYSRAIGVAYSAYSTGRF